MPAEDGDTHRGDRACPGSEELGICSGLQISPLQVPRLPHSRGSSGVSRPLQNCEAVTGGPGGSLA